MTTDLARPNVGACREGAGAVSASAPPASPAAPRPTKPDPLACKNRRRSIRPGPRLSLRGVAGSLGMSMAPVGEALRELSRDGLVESEPRWGTRVRRMTAE